jgi:hypothetical protein
VKKAEPQQPEVKPSMSAPVPAVRITVPVVDSKQAALQRMADMIAESPRQMAAKKFSDGINSSRMVTAQRERLEQVHRNLPRHRDNGAHKSLPPVLQGKSTSACSVVQREWIDSPNNEMQWHPSRGGLNWFYNTATRTMRFEPDGKTDLGDLDQMTGVNKSYRAWINEWKERQLVGADKAESLSFSNYISHIMEIYPPRDFEYVGVGASTDLVLSYLREKFGMRSFSIPISGITNVASADVDDEESWSGEHIQRVMSYITAFIPIDVIKGGKTILLMDVTSGGTTLIVMEQFIKKILLSCKEDPNKVRSFSLNSTIKPDASIFASTDPLVLSKPVPLDPESVVKRKLSPEERKKGVLPAGSLVDRDTVMLEFDEVNRIKKNIRKLRKEYKGLDKVSGKERRKAIKQEVSRLKGLRDAKNFEFYPKKFDMMISDTTDIEDKLDNQDFKKQLGRSHRKVDIKSIMSGETDAEKEKLVGPDKNNIQEYTRAMLLNEEAD